MGGILLLACSVLAFDRRSTSETTTVNSKIAEVQWKAHCQQVAADPSLFLKKLRSAENRLSFTNHGGIMNGGVCWWHSRLTRIAQYLAVFNPAGKPLTDNEAYGQVKRLRQGKPTTFSGFKNFYDFSIVHSEAIQKNLEEWQITNGGFQLGFLDGLSGSSFVSAKEMKTIMDSNFDLFQTTQKPIYQVLQLPGLTAHAWLIIDMVPTLNGYQFDVVDSNYMPIQSWTYKNGDTGFYFGRSPFVAYTTNRGLDEEKLLTQRLESACLDVKGAGNAFQRANLWKSLDEELDALENIRLQ